ncbi:MAG: hypothetical protein HZB42_05240 [Sphingobacteriales bacterium]|nr:hypothetical protein [Sphingobacteriales bacterium]
MYHLIIDWAEAWAPLIPLFFILRKKNKIPWLKPVSIYIWVALLLNLAATLLWKYKVAWGIKEGDFLWSNNFLYNIHSIIRLLLFSWFFILLKQRFMHRIKAVLPFLFLILVAVNFIFFEDFFNRQMLSSRLLATEAAILLFYCLQYYIFLMLEDRSTSLKKQPGFWIVTSLTFYVAVSFFIFLFYTHLVNEDWEFAVDIWDVHNIAFIFLCIFIAIQFHRDAKQVKQ